MDEKRISVVMLTRNEERNIEACLKSCDFADEIILVDDGSTDRTEEIARSFGDRVRIFHHALNGDWAQQQNYGIDRATGRWVFLLDADERVTPELSRRLSELADGPEKAYFVQRHNTFRHIRVSHGPLRPDWVCRFMPRRSVRIYGQVHPEIRVSVPKDKIRGAGMIHYTYRDWNQYVAKQNFYAELSAKKYLESGKSVWFLRDVVLRPMWAFFKIYFINLGVLDGRAGFMFSVGHAFYTMNKYVKYYFLKNYQGEL